MQKYCPYECVCTNVNCDLYKKCEECVLRHHSSYKWILTACEICEKENLENADPVEYFTSRY